MAKVSVIVPVYNGENTIGRCLDSIMAQTFEDIEIIVVNDGSTDGTEGILKKISDSRLKIINTENQGQGLARNRGIDIATGEYLAFVDADDTICPDMIEKLFSAAREKGADMAQCDITDIYPDNSKRKQINLKNETVEIGDKGYYTDMYFTPCVHSYEVCNKLIRRGAVGNLRFRDTRKYFSEDLMFNLELISRLKRVTFISDALYNYYQHDKSHMHNNSEARLIGLRRLFCDFINYADNDMKNAASYTAAMVLAYSAGACYKSGEARDMFKDREFKNYLKRGAKRNCKGKHRLFIRIMSLLPWWGKGLMCLKYSERWK